MNKQRIRIIARSLALVLVLTSGAAAEGAAQHPPRLTVVIVIDQLPAARPLRMHDRLGEGGFRRFLDEGVVYRNAHYGHASTYTAAGHATISTGADPRAHGIVANRWLDPHTGAYTYCVGDDAHTLLDADAKPGNGASPKQLIVPTLGDVLTWHTNGRAKVFAVAGKDRAAVLSAGEHGMAFWYSHAAGGMTSSTFYFDVLPPWVEEWNAEGRADSYAGGAWPLLNPLDTYTYAKEDDRAIEASAGGMGRTFPHPLAGAPGRDLYDELYVTPFLDEMTADFARTLIDHEQLGKDDVPDLFFVSFSASDTVGHQFGPFSLEVEDNFLRLDRLLAGFMRHVDDAVGREHVVYVLTSDHGVDGNPKLPGGEGYLHGFVHPDDLTAAANDAIETAFRVEGAFARGVVVPYLYLNEDALRRAGVPLADAERAAAEALLHVDGVAAAVTRTDLMNHSAASTEFGGAMLRSFHPDRSGHVYIVQKPYHRITSNPAGYTATHGTPYAYDTQVPVYAWAPEAVPATVFRPVGPEDIAPTLALWLGVPAPHRASERPLTELLPR